MREPKFGFQNGNCYMTPEVKGRGDFNTEVIELTKKSKGRGRPKMVGDKHAK